MQASHQYIPGQRSRSPSPNPFSREDTSKNQEASHLLDYSSRYDEDDQGYLKVNNGMDRGRQVRSASMRAAPDSEASGPTRREARINELLHHSHPVGPLMAGSSHTPVPYDVSVKELQDRNRSDNRDAAGFNSSGEMDSLSIQKSNYGSINGGSVNTTHSDSVPIIGQQSTSSTEATSPRMRRQKSYYTPAMVDTLRKRNILYFMDPITKTRHFHSFPWKMILQIIKIVMITAQVVIFNQQRVNMVEYFERSDIAFRHLLLNNWDPSFETMPYPPATGEYAIYSLTDLFDHINNVSQRYYSLPEESLSALHLHHNNPAETGTSGKIEPIQLCFNANKFKEFPNNTYIVSRDLLHNCTYIEPFGEGENRTFNVERFLKERNFSLPFNRTLNLELKLRIWTFHLNMVETHYGPTCYDVFISVNYENTARSGQILVDLQTTRKEKQCEGKIISPEAKDEMNYLKMTYIAFDASVIACCCLSTILCGRSLKRSNQLRKDTAKFFYLQRGKTFRFSDHSEFINIWYIIIIVNDILTIVGSALKMQLENRRFSISSENYAACSMLLGMGIFLTYVGILRYLGFFKSYNVLILTLKTSFPHVIRFLVCALCLYSGFLFCGWIVFSPYHIKFRHLSTASECLYSLVNGDDMFVTFSALTSENYALWYFHRAYLYIFISLFIYVVLSVFIAVIMDNYENLKNYYESGWPETEVQKFINETGELTESEIFSHVRRDGTWQSWFFCVFPCLAWLRSPPKHILVNQAEERRELLGTI